MATRQDPRRSLILTVPMSACSTAAVPALLVMRDTEGNTIAGPAAERAVAA